MRPEDPELAQLLARFVPVRITNFKGVDMNRFRFDYDLTFAILMMNADGETYARFSTRDGDSATDRMSIAGLKKAMRDVLALHKRAPRGKAGTPATRKRSTLADLPAFARSRQAKAECYHCHFAHNTRCDQLRAEGKFTKEQLFLFPLPENIGITLDVDANNVVKSVAAGSPAQRAGIRPGDVLARAGSTRVLTAADLQLALNGVAEEGEVTLRVLRDGKPLPPARLHLPRGWRRTDISWRPSQGSIPPIIGIWEEPLNENQKQQRGIPPDRLALRVSFLFPGEKWIATRGDLKLNDVIISINGRQLPSMTPRQFHTYFRLNFNVGDTATLNVLRGDQRLEIRVPCLDIGED